MCTYRVLVVDDSPLFLAIAAGLLADLPGLSLVGETTSGSEALELAERLEPDLVLTDLGMPGLDGLELTRRLARTPRPPLVVLMTVHDQPQYREAAESAGAAGFLLKADLAEQLPLLIQRLREAPGSEPGG